MTTIDISLKAVGIACDRLQAFLDTKGHNGTPSSEIVLIRALSAALTESRAETAAAYERAAVALDAVAGQWSCGHPAMHCDCARDIEQWGFAADEVRTLATPDQTAALDKLIAEAVGPYVDALIWCSGSADFNDGGFAREGWLKLCARLLAASKKGGV